MVIIKTSLRISIAGGGTDLPEYSSKYGSMFISAAINKYIYTTLHYSKYNSNIRLRYSQMEEVEKVEDIKHDIFRETLRGRIEKGVEITSHAEIPSNTGLGSSGSFGVGILQALSPNLSKETLAQEASRIQMKVLKYPIGIQDQYVAAYGGLNTYEVNQDGEVNVLLLPAPELEKRLVMFYTGIKRNTNEFLEKSSIEGLDKIQELAYKARLALIEGRYDDYGGLLQEHWEYKKQRNKEMTNSQIDKWYELGKKNGAIGGKIVGAGGGGFLLFYTNNREKLIKLMPLMHQPFKFDYEGSKVIYAD